MQLQLTKNEITVIETLRETTPFLSITIKKADYGKIKRITIHRENDVVLEDKTHA
jgi:hypothetical protein